MYRVHERLLQADKKEVERFLCLGHTHYKV